MASKIDAPFGDARLAHVHWPAWHNFDLSNPWDKANSPVLTNHLVGTAGRFPFDIVPGLSSVDKTILKLRKEFASLVESYHEKDESGRVHDHPCHSYGMGFTEGGGRILAGIGLWQIPGGTVKASSAAFRRWLHDDGHVPDTSSFVPDADPESVERFRFFVRVIVKHMTPIFMDRLRAFTRKRRTTTSYPACTTSPTFKQVAGDHLIAHFGEMYDLIADHDFPTLLHEHGTVLMKGAIKRMQADNRKRTGEGKKRKSKDRYVTDFKGRTVVASKQLRFDKFVPWLKGEDEAAARGEDLAIEACRSRDARQSTLMMSFPYHGLVITAQYVLYELFPQTFHAFDNSVTEALLNDPDLLTFLFTDYDNFDKTYLVEYHVVYVGEFWGPLAGPAMASYIDVCCRAGTINPSDIPWDPGHSTSDDWESPHFSNYRGNDSGDPDTALRNMIYGGAHAYDDNVRKGWIKDKDESELISWLRGEHPNVRDELTGDNKRKFVRKTPATFDPLEKPKINLCPAVLESLTPTTTGHIALWSGGRWRYVKAINTFVEKMLNRPRDANEPQAGDAALGNEARNMVYIKDQPDVYPRVLADLSSILRQVVHFDDWTSFLLAMKAEHKERMAEEARAEGLPEWYDLLLRAEDPSVLRALIRDQIPGIRAPGGMLGKVGLATLLYIDDPEGEYSGKFDKADVHPDVIDAFELTWTPEQWVPMWKALEGKPPLWEGSKGWPIDRPIKAELKIVETSLEDKIKAKERLRDYKDFRTETQSIWRILRQEHGSEDIDSREEEATV